MPADLNDRYRLRCTGYDTGCIEESIFELEKNSFCSAGDNDPGSGTFNKFPASITSPNILSLAAVKKDKVIKASCKSDHITLAAPGADVKVVIKPTPNNEQGITIDSGTSFSAPFAAGIMALMLSRRKKLVSRSPMKLRFEAFLGGVKPAGDRLLYGKGVLDPTQSFLNLENV